MKINGLDPKSLSNEVVLVLPRGDGELVFRAVGLKDMDAFTAQCPVPQPPGKMTRDGYVPTLDDPTYQQVLQQWSLKRLGYMVYHSLRPSNIEWDTVRENDPRTWTSWEKDLRDGGLSEVEASRVLSLVMEANALDEAKLKKARDSFLLGQGPVSPTSSGPAIGPASTPSGVPVQE
jgi:hypothetical protein